MITLHVNGQAQSFDGDPSMPVLWYLRDVLGAYWHEVRVRSGGLRRLHGSSRRRKPSDPV